MLMLLVTFYFAVLHVCIYATLLNDKNERDVCLHFYTCVFAFVANTS